MFFPCSIPQAWWCWQKCGRTAGAECRYKVTGVIEGTEVQFQVRAENEAGVGHPSEPTEIYTIEDKTGRSGFDLCFDYTTRVKVSCIHIKRIAG